MKWLVVVKSTENGSILDAFAMKNKGIAFFFLDKAGDWVNPTIFGGLRGEVFDILFADESELLIAPSSYMEFYGDYLIEVTEL